ncbi:MAG: hypothetical protein J0L92_13200 [Deltaproteobacteria bacterium]|nr:hypothetical protein [Deltaproteobacteria bacterium]
MPRKLKRRVAGTEVSRETLLQTPNRAFTLMYGIGRLPNVRTAMVQCGFTDAEHDRGYNLLAIVTRGIPVLTVDLEVASATTALDNWDEDGIAMISAAFTRFPDAHESVLTGLAPIVGPRAVENVATILERLDELEKTEDGREALARLATAGMDEKNRKELAALVKTARAKDKMKVDEAALKAEEKFEEALLDLRDWYVEWAEIARIVVKRRDYLIVLGLAERRGGGGGGDDLDIIDPTPFLDPNKPTDPNSGT